MSMTGTRRRRLTKCRIIGTLEDDHEMTVRCAVPIGIWMTNVSVVQLVGCCCSTTLQNNQHCGNKQAYILTEADGPELACDLCQGTSTQAKCMRGIDQAEIDATLLDRM